MDFRKETRGEHGTTKAVELVIGFYDTSVVRAKETNEVTNAYGESWGHPDSEIGKNQTNLALLTKSVEFDGKPKIDHSTPFSIKQLEQIKAAAGDNVAPLLDKDGVRRGTLYGVRADLFRVLDKDKEKVVGYMPNTKTLQASELSVADVNGVNIRDRIFAAQAEAKAAKAAAAPSKAAPEVEVAEVAPSVELEPELA
ncbi:MAG TPA: hypothetical protein VFU07_05260 [Candidatus Lumbricidophila sp.]|nr:hypothetical protein [Candidatus Lumbricidophila sp.]